MFKMAAGLSTRATKRSASAISDSDTPPKLSKVTLLSPSLLLLEIPPDVNTSLPVWDDLRSQQAEVTWTVNPYSINVQFSPKARKQVKEPFCEPAQNTVVSSNVLQPHMVIQSITPHHDASQNTRVLLTFLQNNTQLLLGQPPSAAPNCEPATSLVLSLPLIITQPQPIRQSSIAAKKGDLPIIQTLLTAPAKSTKPPNSPFHTKTLSDIDICDNFLLNKCSYGKKCKMHHTPYPFHWQLRCVHTQQWIDIPPHAQVLLEKIYCDVDQDMVYIKDGSARYNLSFDSMRLDDPSKYNGVRRLSNSYDPENNPYFPCTWRIFWWNSTNWEHYDEVVSSMLLQKMRDKVPECKFSVNTKEYKMNFTKRSQTNIKTGFSRNIRCRPKFHSPESMLPYLQSGIQTDPAPKPIGANFNLDPLKEFSSWYPPVWCPTSEEEEYNLIDVPAGTRAYQSIQDAFYQSLPETKVDMISIQQVQNLLHWDKYQRYKSYMQKHHAKSKEPLERHLFHGTTKESAEDICHNNFDPRLAGVNGVSHGYGVYFATSASFSNTYTAKEGRNVVRHMFLARVLVGKMHLGQNNYRRPPALSNRMKHRLFDTCVDNLAKPTMFVVFDSCQCYPYYLIKYKEISKEIYI